MEPVSRVNYYSGEALLTADFQDEQRYHIRVREQLSQGLLMPGVLEGLDVEWVYPAVQVTVKVGAAIDSEGQLIVLAQERECAPVLTDAINYLTIGFNAYLDDSVTNMYGSGHKRLIEDPTIACSPTYDPNGLEILLAVITTSGTAITSVLYHYGDYMRRHAGAKLQSVQFIDEANAPPWPPASISLNRDTLEIDAPNIQLNGNVEADSLSATGTFSGVFSGIFSGDGSLLTLPESSNYWQQNGSDIYYTAGNVAIGDEDASMAHLTIRQSALPPTVATGLISLESDGKTVTGYQTCFTTELKVGQVIAYDFVPPQTATIVSIVSNKEVIIDRRLAIDLGPAFFSTRHEGTVTSGGAAKVTAEGTTLTCTGGTFPPGLAAGDQIILTQSDENNSKLLRVQSIGDDTHMTVVGMSPSMAAKGGPKLSAFSATHSVLLVAGGAHPAVEDLPPALAVAQNGSGAPMPNSVGINVESGSLDGRYALDVQGAIKATRWPATATDAALMMTVGSTAASPYEGLSVTDNGASAAVPKTVAVNVDSIDPTYALDVNGPLRAASLAVSSGGFDIGTLKASSEIDTDKIGPYTASGSIEVTSDVTFDKTIKASGTNPLTVAGDFEVKENATIDGSLTVTGSVNVTGDISGKLHNPIPGPFNVDGVFGVLDGNNPVLTAGGNKVTVSVDLYAQGDLNVVGALTTDALTVSQRNARGIHVFDVSDDGDVSMMGSLTVGENGDDNFQVSPQGAVTIADKGSLSLGDRFELLDTGEMKCFGKSVTKIEQNVGVNTTFLNATATTDGFVVVYADPKYFGFGSCAQVVVQVTPPAGDPYTLCSPVYAQTAVGRAATSATVPVPKGGTCVFTAELTAGGVPTIDVTVTWIPLGSGSLQGL